MSGVPAIVSLLPRFLRCLNAVKLAQRLETRLMSALERDVTTMTGGATLSSRFINAVYIEGVASCSPLTIDAAFASQDLQVISTVLRHIRAASAAVSPLPITASRPLSIEGAVSPLRPGFSGGSETPNTAELALRASRAAMIVELYRHARVLEDKANFAAESRPLSIEGDAGHSARHLVTAAPITTAPPGATVGLRERPDPEPLDPHDKSRRTRGQWF